mgnify:CR=1 FL=1
MKTTRPLWKRALRYSLFTLAGVVGLLVLAVLLVWSNRRKIAEMELTNLLRTQITYEEMEVNLAQHWPEIEVTLHKARLASTNPRLNQQAFTFRKAFLRIDPFKIFGKWKKKEVELIELDGVDIEIFQDPFYTNNSAIFAHYDPDRPAPDSVIIHRIVVRDTWYHYHVMNADRDHYHYFDEIAGSIRITKPRVQVDLDAEGFTRYWYEGDFSLLENRPIRFQTSFYVQKATKAMHIQAGNLVLDGANLKLQGEFPLRRDSYVDLAFEIPKGNIETLLSLLPASAGKEIRQFQPTGKFAFQGRVQGVDSDTSNPHVEINFSAEDAGVKTTVEGLDLSNLSFNGTFSNGPQNRAATTYLEIRNLNGALSERPLHADLRLSEFNNLQFSADIDAVLGFANLERVLPVDFWSTPTGLATVDLEMAGRLQALRDVKRIDELNYRGSVVFDSVGVAPIGYPIRVRTLSGQLAFNGPAVQLDSLGGYFNEQPVFLTGDFPTAISYLAGNNDTLSANFTAEIPRFSVDTFLISIQRFRQRLARQKQPQPGPDSTVKPSPGLEDSTRHWLDFSLPPNYNIGLDMRMANITYKEAYFDSLAFNAAYRDQRLQVPRAILWNTDSELLFNFLLNGQDPEKNQWQSRIDFNTIHLSKLLHTTGIIDDPLADHRLWNGLEIEIDGFSEHNLPAGQLPQAQFNFNFSQGYFRDDSSGILLDSLQFSYCADQQLIVHPRTTPIVLDTLQGLLNGRPLGARFALSDIENQGFVLVLNTVLPLEVLLNIRPVPSLNSTEGLLAIHSLLKGSLKDFRSFDRWGKLRASGELELSEGATKFSQNALTVTGAHALARFDSGSVAVDSIELKLGKTDFSGQASLPNLGEFLFAENAALKGELALQSDSLLLDEIIAALAPQRPKEKPDSSFSLENLPQTDVRLGYTTNHLSAGDFRADSLLLKAYLHSAVADLKKLQFRFAEGFVFALGKVDFSNPDSIRVMADMNLETIQFSQFLKTFNNFNQELITDSTAFGLMDARLTYRDILPANLKPSFKHTQALMSLTIREGELINFRPLYKLDRIFDPSQLDTLNFLMEAPMLRWEDQALRINGLVLETSLFDMIVEGKHTLNSRLDYDLWISLRRRRRRLLDTRLSNWLYGRPATSVIGLKITGKARETHINYATERSLRNLGRKIFW